MIDVLRFRRLRYWRLPGRGISFRGPGRGGDAGATLTVAFAIALTRWDALTHRRTSGALSRFLTLKTMMNHRKAR